MRYDTAVNKFWRIGYKMFHGKWLRYMSGPKNKGDLVNRLSAPGEFDPKGSRINFPKRSISPYFPLIEQLIFFPSKHSLNVWSLLVCSDTLSSKWVNTPGRWYRRF
jgi:hypothetical protein